MQRENRRATHLFIRALLFLAISEADVAPTAASLCLEPRPRGTLTSTSLVIFLLLCIIVFVIIVRATVPLAVLLIAVESERRAPRLVRLRVEPVLLPRSGRLGERFLLWL